MYILVSRASHAYVGFILLAVASALMIYWVREIKNMVHSDNPKSISKEQDQKDWVYDLIKNNNEMIFVAEVPGPEDQINVKLSTGMLHIKGGQSFVKEVPLDLTSDMGISDLKYRNGVLTIKIQKL